MEDQNLVTIKGRFKNLRAALEVNNHAFSQSGYENLKTMLLIEELSERITILEERLKIIEQEKKHL